MLFTNTLCIITYFVLILIRGGVQNLFVHCSLSIYLYRDAALSTVSSTESEPDQLAPGTKYESKRPPQKVPVLKRTKR